MELSDAISIAVDRIQRGFEPMKEQIRVMKEQVLTEEAVKLIIYQAFLDRGIRGIPRHLMPVIHDYYFHPKHEAFTPRNLWSLSNAFTSALKKLAPIKQFEVTARLGDYLGKVQEELEEKQELEFELRRGGKLIPISQGAAEQDDLGEEDFDLDDAAEDLAFEEAFDEYFDSEEASESIDEAEDDEMIQEFKRRVAA